MPQPAYKCCPRCSETKPVADFTRNRAKRDGLSAYCRPCTRTTKAEWEARNPERVAAYQDRHWAPRDRKCYRCGEAKPIEDFAKDRTKATGHKSICKGCDRDKSKLHYLAKHGGYKKRSHEAARMEQDYLTALRNDPCAYCGQPFGGEIDHIEPKVREGEDSTANMTGSCDSCNRSKNALPLLYFMGRRTVDVELTPLLERRAGWIAGDARGDHFKDARRWAERRGVHF